MKPGLGDTYLGMSREQWALALCASIGLGGIALAKVVPHLRLRLPRFFRRQAFRPGAIRIGDLLISDEARLRHTHLVGATGTGKTEAMKQLIFRDLERGQGALIIDPKGDRKFYEEIRRFCAAIGREEDLYLLSATHSAESVCWNPCRVGNAAELQSKFYNSAIYSEPHYAKACELALLKAFKQLGTKEAIGLRELVAQLDDLSEGGKDKNTAGLFMDLNNLAMGDWGPLLNPETSERREISLLNLTRKNEILFVDLPTEAQAVQSARIGRLLLQEVILTSGLRKLYPHLKNEKPFSVFIDEFDAFAVESFISFLNKGRSGDFMIHLAHQTLSDLRKISPTFEEQVMGNMNVRFVFRQDSADDAEKWSRFFGTKTTVKRTFQTQDGQQTGMSSNREVLEFRVTPDSIKDLGIGECIFGIKTDKLIGNTRLPFGAETSKPLFGFPTQRPRLGEVHTAARRGAKRPSMTEHCSKLSALVTSAKQNASTKTEVKQ